MCMHSVHSSIGPHTQCHSPLFECIHSVHSLIRAPCVVQVEIDLGHMHSPSCMHSVHSLIHALCVVQVEIDFLVFGGKRNEGMLRVLLKRRSDDTYLYVLGAHLHSGGSEQGHTPCMHPSCLHAFGALIPVHCARHRQQGGRDIKRSSMHIS